MVWWQLLFRGRGCQVLSTPTCRYKAETYGHSECRCGSVAVLPWGLGPCVPEAGEGIGGRGKGEHAGQAGEQRSVEREGHVGTAEACPHTYPVHWALHMPRVARSLLHPLQPLSLLFEIAL